MSIWVRLPPTAALLAFGVIIYIRSNLLQHLAFLLCQNLCWQNRSIPKYGLFSKIQSHLPVHVAHCLYTENCTCILTVTILELEYREGQSSV